MKGKYPSRGGLALPIHEIGFAVPSPEQLATKRRTTVHHLYFERARYNDVRFRSIFRNLLSNTYPMLQEEHIGLHNEYAGPPMPKDVAMVDVIEEYLGMNGVIHCIREKKTSSFYEIQPADWINLREGYKSRGQYSMGN